MNDGEANGGIFIGSVTEDGRLLRAPVVPHRAGGPEADWPREVLVSVCVGRFLVGPAGLEPATGRL